MFLSCPLPQGPGQQQLPQGPGCPGAHPLQLHSALGASGGIAEDATSTTTDHAQPWGFPVQELRDPLGSTWRHGWLRASSAQTEP